jgi:hypothetical protein
MKLNRTILPEGGVIALLFESCVGIAEKASAMTVRAAEGLGNGCSAVFDTVTSVSMGSFISGSSGPAVSHERAPDTPAVAPAKATQYDVNPAELGSFSAPNFGTMPVNRGAGMNI